MVAGRLRLTCDSVGRRHAAPTPGNETLVPRRITAVLGAVLASATGLGLVAAPAPAAEERATTFSPGAAGAGDAYFPTDGNGGYDATHYELRVTYQPRTNRLVGRTTMQATATQDLSRFDLDLRGLTVRGVLVDGHRASWRRYDHELVVTPPQGLPVGTAFATTVQYDGVPRTLPDGSGFIHTRDGAVVVGQPE